MKVESEIIVWALFDDIRSIKFADDGKFLNLHGKYLSYAIIFGINRYIK